MLSAVIFKYRQVLKGSMHSPYEPVWSTPISANLLRRAETFKSDFGITRSTIKVSITGSTKGALRNAFKQYIKSSITVSARALRKTLKGASDEVIEVASKNPDKFADTLGLEVANYIKKTEAKELASIGDQVYRSMPTRKPTDDISVTFVDSAGDTKTLTYTADEVAGFYTEKGSKRTITFDEDKISDGSGWVTRDTSNGQVTTFLDDLSRKSEVTTSVDKLADADGPLSAKAINKKTSEIATSSEFEKALLGRGARLPTPDEVLDRVAKSDGFLARSFTVKRVGGVTVIGVMAYAGIKLADALPGFVGGVLGLTPDCRANAEATFPDDPVKQEEFIEECLDEAANRVVFFGAATLGILGIIALFIIKRLTKG